MKENDENLFIEISEGNRVLYIKVPITFINSLHDSLHDRGFKVKQSGAGIWEYHINFGLSYELRKEEDIIGFISNNLKYLINENK